MYAHTVIKEKGNDQNDIAHQFHRVRVTVAKDPQQQQQQQDTYLQHKQKG